MIKIIINGNTESIKGSMLEELKNLYQVEETGAFIPIEIAVKISEITNNIKREISVFIDRKGNILDISIGDFSSVVLPLLDKRRGEKRLSGTRCIHTHPNSIGKLSTLDINALISLRLDAMIALGVKDGHVNEVYVGMLKRDERDELNKYEEYGPFELYDESLDEFIGLINHRDRAYQHAMYMSNQGIEKAILVGLELSEGSIIDNKSSGDRSLDELSELAITAGAEVLKAVLQKRTSIDSAYYIGKGKIEELSLLRQALDANIFIFDDELSGAQVRNIEKLLGVKVIDRTALILDIFAKRARSKEGKIQVELAQLKYRLPRLIGIGAQMSRLGGGIGTRGPGEKKLEVDKRHINKRISVLESELRSLQKRRELIRRNRNKSSIPTIALVGYTNVGKSTIMNVLCKSDVFAENKLFATLDPTTRVLKLKDGKEALLVDTVGFIRKLPHDLIEAFKSTLEEALYADYLIHVVDISSNQASEQIVVVNNILEELGINAKKTTIVLNKIDLGSDISVELGSREYERVYYISAATGHGIKDLQEGICDMISGDEEEVNLFIPYDQSWAISYVHDNGRIVKEEYVENGSNIEAVLKKTKIGKINDFIR